MKKITVLTAALMVMLMFAPTLHVAAADRATNTNIIFENGSGHNFKVEGGSGADGFGEMEPGEAKSLDLTLSNDSADEMKFYMSANILKDIAQEGDSRTAVYTFDISKNDSDTSFFSAVISGGANNNISIGKEYLTDNNILLDTLKKGESSKVSIVLELDGDSAGNDYQGTSGEVQFVFSSELPGQPVTNVVNKVVNYVQGAGTNIIKTVKTGDKLSVGLIAAVLISFVVIIALLIVKRKKGKEEEQ